MIPWDQVHERMLLAELVQHQDDLTFQLSEALLFGRTVLLPVAEEFVHDLLPLAQIPVLLSSLTLTLFYRLF